MTDNALFERLWTGTAEMEEWTAAVSAGAFTEITPNVITVHSTYFCGSVTAIRTSEGLVLIDTAGVAFAKRTLEVVRSWDQSRIHTVIYTHGHVDHTSGITEIDQEADANGVARPHIVAHRNTRRRMQRYIASHGYNSVVQAQQFNTPGYVYPIGQRFPDEVYDDTLTLTIGGEEIQLFHGRGETDDGTFVWLPQHRVLASGDFVIWVFPNAGNPRKVQRYAADWAVALRQMEALRPEILVPGHGPVVFGAERAALMLRDGAEALEYLTGEVLRLMNTGATLDQVLHAVKVPSKYLDKPYLKPKYDDPEFLVRAAYHFYGGWFDGNPAHLKPAKEADLAAEITALAGGAGKLADRAAVLANEGQTRLAAHLIEFASMAAPDDKSVQSVRAFVLQKCIDGETSLMAKAFYGVSLREAEGRAKGR